MSTCLDDRELQAVIDGVGSPGQQAHADRCATCRQRLAERGTALEAFGDLVNAGPVPPELERRVLEALEGTTRVAGGTTLRPSTTPRVGLYRVVLPVAVAAVVAVFVFAVLPRLGAPTEISAAEVVARSAHALGEAVGVERLEYEFRMDGVRSPLLSNDQDLAAIVRQVIDHDGGRFLAGKYAPDGTLIAGMAEDPVAGTRTMIVRIEGRRYVTRLALPPGPRVSLPKLARTLVRTWLGLLQASGATSLSLSRTSEGGLFVVQSPQLSVEPGGAWDLESARLVIDANDYHLVEVDTRGHLLGSAYHVSFRLRTRELGGTAHEGDFAFQPEPGDFVLDGDASDNPFWDIGSAALRSLAAKSAPPAARH
jgi:hypothetical protein